MEVRHHPEDSRYELVVDGRVTGVADYRDTGAALVFHHTEVDPDQRGRGLGRVLVSGVHAIARDCGLEFLHLTVRGGTGLEAFYATFGYREFGRMPGAVRVAPGDDRDELHLTCRL